MKWKRFVFMALIGVFGIGCSIFGIRSEEQPPYEVVAEDGKFEIRKYREHIVAKTTVSGNFEEAQGKSFRILAGYIFGKNKSQQKIAMTAPVVQVPEDKIESESEKIAMTAPVVLKPGESAGGKGKSWTMTFTMPSKYSLKTLPTPEDDRVVLEVVKERLLATSSFSGFYGTQKVKKKGEELLAWVLEQKAYQSVAKPMFAGYDPPWTLPFLRRNEMLVEITPTESKD